MSNPAAPRVPEEAARTGSPGPETIPDEPNPFGPDAPNLREDDPPGGPFVPEAQPDSPPSTPLAGDDFAPDEV